MRNVESGVRSEEAFGRCTSNFALEGGHYSDEISNCQVIIDFIKMVNFMKTFTGRLCFPHPLLFTERFSFIIVQVLFMSRFI